MAELEYWVQQFKQASAATLAMELISRLGTKPRVERWLEDTGPGSLVVLTRGNSGKFEVGKAVVKGAKIADDAIVELQSTNGPLNEVILRGLALEDIYFCIVQNQFAPGLHSPILEKALSVKIGDIAYGLPWWKENAKEFKRGCKAYQSMKEIHES